MLVKNNGCYFSDYKAYVTDKDQLNSFAEYLLSLSNHFEATEELVVFSADEDIEDIDKIDQYKLFDYYSVTFTPKYQVEDIVWAWVPENHLKGHWIKDFKGYVLTKVQIKSAAPLNPIRSYFGTQLERDWNFSDQPCFNEMKLDTSKSPIPGIGCELNDSLIVGKVAEIPMPDMAINHHVDSNGLIKSDYFFDSDSVIEYMKNFN